MYVINQILLAHTQLNSSRVLWGRVFKSNNRLKYYGKNLYKRHCGLSTFTARIHHMKSNARTKLNPEVILKFKRSSLQQYRSACIILMCVSRRRWHIWHNCQIPSKHVIGLRNSKIANYTAIYTKDNCRNIKKHYSKTLYNTGRVVVRKKSRFKFTKLYANHQNVQICAAYDHYLIIAKKMLPWVW